MNIYTPITITEQMINSFVPCRLYIKELSGVKYFGKTSSNHPEKYIGSGLAWKNRVKKYGKRNIRTLWVSDWYYDPHEIMIVALNFSKENDIVNSKEWDNLKPEFGVDGGSPKGINKGKPRPLHVHQALQTGRREYEEKCKTGEIIRPTIIVDEDRRKHLSIKQKEYAANNPEEMSRRAKQATMTKENNGTLLHTELSKEKMRKPKSPSAVINMKNALNNRGKGYNWINDGVKQKTHNVTKFGIPKGWKLGKLNKTTPPSQKGKFWITNGESCKMSYDIPEGWRRGRK